MVGHSRKQKVKGVLHCGRQSELVGGGCAALAGRDGRRLACAGVCREWRRIVGTSAAYSYGRDRAGWIERRRVLRGVAQALDRELSGQYDDHHLGLNGLRLGDAGAGALGAALAVRLYTRRRVNAQSSDLPCMQAKPVLGGKGFRPATDRREGHDAPRFNELHLQSNGMTLEGVTSLAQPLQR